MKKFLTVGPGIYMEHIKERYKFDLDDFPDLLSSLDICASGEIFGIKPEKIIPILDRTEIYNMRNGLARYPASFKIKTEEDFLKVIALSIDISEY